GERAEAGPQQHQEGVSGGPPDNAADHGDFPWPCGAAKFCNAARRLLSASIRKLAPTTTFSPSATPSSTATYPSAFGPSLTARGSNRPSPRSTSTVCLVPVSSTAESGIAKMGAASSGAA